MKWHRMTAAVLAWVAVMGVIGCAGAVVAEEAQGAQGSRPNVIFIMVDDMGYGDLGSYGNQVIQTPHLDAMAREGIRFTEVYSGSPVCAPARSVLMTGQHTGHTRVRGNAARSGDHGAVRGLGRNAAWRMPLLQEDVTVAEVLQEAGYVTGMTGKWGLGEPDSVGHPNRQGFDEWFGFLNQNRAHNHYNDYIWHNETKYILEGNRDGNAEQYTHDLFSEWALDFIRRHGDGAEPFFLYLPYCVPHDRFQVPALEPYAAETDWPDQAKIYASMITRMDRDIGRMMRLLKAMDIDENTIVFFCSDNGAANRYDDVLDSSGALRGRKRDMYDGGIRTPMIVRWPNRVPAGVESDAIWYFPDVMPTLAALAGAEPPGGIDGVNVLASLLGEDQPALRERYLYWEFYEGGFRQAARRGDWKVVRRRHDRPLELYNLAEDIGETTDVAGQHPQIVAEFEAFLRGARTVSPNWPSPID